jgi:hypothetical protein
MEIKKRQIDGLCRKIKNNQHFDYPLTRFVRIYKNSSTLFSDSGQTQNFTTSNLKLYYLKNKSLPDFSYLDGILRSRKKINVAYAVRYRREIIDTILDKYGSWKEYANDLFTNPLDELSTVKLWNASVIGALFVGMFLMTFIYKYLGEGASAKSNSKSDNIQSGQVLGDSTKNQGNADDNQAVKEYVSKILDDYQKQNEQDAKNEDARQKNLEKEITDMVKGHPIEQMIPYIAKQNTIVAAFMIGIAKQESGWGEHVPVDKNGNDCFNYWGYRGKNPVGTGGHSCFASPEDAVNTVAKRLSFLVSNEKADTPGKMVKIWKCGYDCSWDNPKSVARWIDSVSIYFGKLNK